MKLYATIILLATLFLHSVVFAQTDSVVAMDDETLVLAQETQAQDTLVNLNKQLNGLKDVVVAPGVVLPEAIEITPEGLIILTQKSLKADAYNFEVRATSREGEVYMVDVKIRREGQSITSTVVADKIDMATGFRKEGKIYVVVAVSLVLFAVIVIYLVLLDRRLRKINARIEQKQ